MLTHSQARSTALSRWSSDSAKSYKTNRKGAFYFKCNQGGGFVIDNEALSRDERRALGNYARADRGSQLVDLWTDEVKAFSNPYAKHFRSNHRLLGRTRAETISIWTFDQFHEWVLPVIFAGIVVKGYEPQDPIGMFEGRFKPSNHQKLEAMAAYARHFPDPEPEVATEVFRERNFGYV